MRVVTVSVPNLEAFCARAERGFGLVREDLRLHGPEHEHLWGLDGAERNAAVLRGGGVALEVVEYASPRGRPWPDGHRLSDFGCMNVAVGFRDRGEFDRCFASARAEGWTPHARPVEAGLARVMYVDDPDGFDVEMLCARTWADRLTGFAPSTPYAVAEQLSDAAPADVWARVSDIAGMKSWSGLPVRVEEPGSPGVGTRRRVKIMGSWVTEKIVEWDPPNRYAYELTGGAPLSNHHGEVHVIPEGEGSRIRWAVRFRPRIPLTGRLIAAALEHLLRQALSGLASNGERPV